MKQQEQCSKEEKPKTEMEEEQGSLKKSFGKIEEKNNEEENDDETKAEKGKEQELTPFPPKEKKIKKLSLIKKKCPKPSMVVDPLHSTPVLKKMYQIGEVIVMNEDSLRDPENNRESFIYNSLHFSRITSVNYNEQFFTMNLKRCGSDNYLSAEYMYERYMSFQNTEMMKVATDFKNMLEEISLHEESIKEIRNKIGEEEFWNKVEIVKKNREALWNNILWKEHKDKKYIALCYADGLKSLSLNKIIVSNAMLEFAGMKLSDLVSTYSKDKTLSFELMGALSYKETFINGARATTEQMIQRRLSCDESIIELDPEKESISDYKLSLPGEIFRKRYANEIEWEEKIKCPLTFYKPLAHIGIFEFEVDELAKPVLVMNRRTKEFKEIEFEAHPSIESELMVIEQNKRKEEEEQQKKEEQKKLLLSLKAKSESVSAESIKKSEESSIIQENQQQQQQEQEQQCIKNKHEEMEEEK